MKGIFCEFRSGVPMNWQMHALALLTRIKSSTCVEIHGQFSKAYRIKLLFLEQNIAFDENFTT